jgi:hypothetical protein
MIGTIARTTLAVAFVVMAARSPACAQERPQSMPQGMPQDLPQDLPGAGEDARYSFHPVDEGFMRLDGRTGGVSLCARRSAGWTCQAVADDRLALEAEIARLQGENIALKRELLGRRLPLPGTVRPAPTPAKPEPPRAAPRGEAEGNGMLAMLGKVWRRLVDLIASWRRDILG